MKALNNKILYELLPEEEQPKKTIFTPQMDLLKKVRVLDIGSKVQDMQIGDILTLYVNNMNQIGQNQGFCVDRDVIFINDIPQRGKVHIRNVSKESLSSFSSADVIESHSEDVKKEDKIFFKEGQSFELPDNSEIISETQIFYKK